MNKKVALRVLIFHGTVHLSNDPYTPTPHEENLTVFKINTTHTTQDTTVNNIVLRKTRLTKKSGPPHTQPTQHPDSPHA